jgi:hypothetical protein
LEPRNFNLQTHWKDFLTHAFMGKQTTVPSSLFITHAKGGGIENTAKSRILELALCCEWLMCARWSPTYTLNSIKRWFC